MKNILIKKLLKSLGLLLGLSLVFSDLLPLSTVEAQTLPARLSFTPTSQTVSGTGRTGNINAFLNPGGASVSSVELVITFNPNVLSVNNITPGAFFNSTSGSPIEIIKNIDNTAGRIHYAVGFPLGSGRSSTAQNSVAVINFTSRGSGTSAFNFVTSGNPSTRVANLSAQNVLGGTTSGSVVVSTGSTTNTPTPRPSTSPTATLRPSNTPTLRPSTTATPTVRPSTTVTQAPINGASVTFSPTSQTIAGTSRNGTVNISLNPNNRSVASAEFVITFNPSIVRVNSINPGTFFNSASGSPVEIIKNIDNTAGRIHYAVGFPLGSGRSSTTANIAAVISFTSVAPGTSALSFVTSGALATRVSDINAQNVLGNTTPGSIVVTSGTVTSPTQTPTRNPSLSPTNRPTGSVSASPTSVPGTGSRLLFTPTSQNVSSVGGTGTVNAFIDPRGENVSSIEFWIGFDPTVIEVTNITPGPFFTQSGVGSPVEITKNIDNSTGRIHYAIGFPLGSGYFSSASNVAAVISFSSIAEGTSQLSYLESGTTSTRVSDINARNVLGSVANGSITVGSGTGPTPSPVPTIGGGATRSVSAIADTYVSSEYRQFNNGKKPQVTVTEYDGNVRTGFLKFNIGNVRLTGAQLELRIALDRKVSKKLYTTSSNWGEFTLNFDNKPAIGAQIGTYNSSTRLNVGQVIRIPLDASKLIPDSNGNVSIVIDNTGIPGSLVFTSKEEGHPAKLIFTTQATTSVSPTRKPTATISVNSPTPTKTPSPTSCFNTSTGSQWVNRPIDTRTGNYSVTFSATPKEINDSYIGLSNGPADMFTDLVSIVHFTHNGTIVARDEIQYAATQIIRYTPGRTYYFRLEVNSADKTYSAYVTPEGGSEVKFADNYSFRLEQQNNSSVNNLASYSRTSANGLQVCMNAVPGSLSPTPSVSEPEPTTEPGVTISPEPTEAPVACTPTNGDANGDGVANDADYEIWDENYATATEQGPADGDFNCSGFVDGVDYVIWLIYTKDLTPLTPSP